jgi:hypothetical protein
MHTHYKQSNNNNNPRPNPTTHQVVKVVKRQLGDGRQAEPVEAKVGHEHVKQLAHPRLHGAPHGLKQRVDQVLGPAQQKAEQAGHSLQDVLQREALFPSPHADADRLAQQGEEGVDKSVHNAAEDVRHGGDELLQGLHD